MSQESAAQQLVVGALGDYDDFNLLPRSSARHLGLIPRRGGLLLPHTAGPSVTEPALVVLTGWLLASERSIPRYLDLYRAQGCDVLWFPVHPIHILFPGTGEGLAERVLAITELLLLRPRRLIFHLMSAGAYMFGQMLQAMSHRPGGYGRIKDNMVGLVFDSPVDTVGIPTAAADILGARPGDFMWRLVHGVLGTYFTLTYALTMSRLKRASGNVRDGGFSSDNEWLMKIPQLWLYSDDDRVASAAVIEDSKSLSARDLPSHKFWSISDSRLRVPTVVAGLVGLGCDVETYKWDSSEHVKHIVEHADEYARLVQQFMGDKLGLPLPAGEEISKGEGASGGVSSSGAAGQSGEQRVALILETAHARL